MYKTSFFLSGAILMALMAAAPARVEAQNFDTSGTASVSGPYLFRYVNFFNDASGNLTESCSLTGVMTFDGTGKYTTSNTQLFDSGGSTTGLCTSLGGGTYGVQSNGMAQLDNPLYAATLFGTFSKPVIIASSTEDDYFDLFIAVQAPAASFSNSNLSGAFTVGTQDFDFVNAASYVARQGYFTLTADGKGDIAAFTATGSTANSGNSVVTQSVAGSTYALSGTTGGTLTLPAISSDQTQIIGGTKVLFVSADGNYVVGGSATGSDMIFGFRAPTGTSSNSLLSGTYFMAGMEDGLTNAFLDAFYGSINTNGDGNLFWHERFDDVVDIDTYDSTFNTPVTIGSDGSFYDGSTYNYFVGANGTAVMLIGSGQQFSFIVGVHAPSITATSTVWINPIGITNAANYTPITNAYAPGELVSLYGTFGVAQQVDKVLPIPTELGGVQVFVNGRAAPVYLVSPTQISVLIPYEVSGEFFATFQVEVNGSKSNSVTVYADNSAPGIYSLTENGIGPGAILHADFSEVTSSSPATPGETVLLFMNGLGTVTPQVGDGAAGPSKPLSYSDEYNNSEVYIVLDDGSGNFPMANLTYAGLAPGFAGLYQVNFTLPTSGVANGDVGINFNTLEAETEMATVNVSGFSDGFARSVPGRPRAKLRRHAVAAGAPHVKAVKNHRRALPDRIVPMK